MTALYTTSALLFGFPYQDASVISEFTVIYFLYLHNLSVTFSILVFLPSIVVIMIFKFNYCISLHR